MGRHRWLVAATLGVVVVTTALTLSTASVDSTDGSPGSTPTGSRPGAPSATPSGAVAPGSTTVPCGRPVGCRNGSPSPTSGSTHGSSGSSGGSGSSVPGSGTTNPSSASAGGSPTSATQVPTTTATTPATATTTRPGPTTSSPPAGNGPARSTPSAWWRPAVVVAWQWELDHPLDLSSASDMGTGATTYLGAPAPDPTVYDIDGFDNSAATVSALHARGDHAVCYIEVGAAESYRPDYAQFPAADLGAAVSGYPSERYLDINDPAVVRGHRGSHRHVCVEGVRRRRARHRRQLHREHRLHHLSGARTWHYDTTLSAYAHGLGLGWALKNGDDPGFAASMQPAADFVVDEQCHQYDTCGSFTPFAAAGKAVLEVEYSEASSQFCPAADAANQDSMAMDVSLSGGRQPCR